MCIACPRWKSNGLLVTFLWMFASEVSPNVHLYLVRFASFLPRSHEHDVAEVDLLAVNVMVILVKRPERKNSVVFAKQFV